LDRPIRQTNQTDQSDRPTRQANQTVQLDRPNGQSNWTDHPPFLVSKKEDLLTKKGGAEKKETFGESSWAIGDETIAIAWPYLAAAGWRQHQLDQLQKIFTVKGIDFTVAQQAMNYAEWQLLNGGINDREGKPVNDPVAWLFKALSTFGYYKRPQGYISPEEQLAKDRAEEAKRIELLEKKAEQAEKKFDRAKALAWFDALSPEAQDEILSAQPGGNPVRNEPWIVRAWNNKGKPTKS
jgi:hypothetical protein